MPNEMIIPLRRSRADFMPTEMMTPFESVKGWVMPRKTKKDDTN